MTVQPVSVPSAINLVFFYMCYVRVLLSHPHRTHILPLSLSSDSPILSTIESINYQCIYHYLANAGSATHKRI